MNSTMHSTPAGSVTEQWGRIARWVSDNLNGVTFDGADSGAINAAMEATGIEWPSELVELLGLINGFPADRHVSLLPQHAMFDVQRVVDERAMELDVWSEFSEEFGGLEPGTEAGGVVGTYHPAFVPFAGLDGYLFVVDTRPGPLHGCVTEFEKVDADGEGPRWVSMSAMLPDLADSLETGCVFDQSSTPAVVDGHLEWQYGTEE
ncbi:hypothetical protein [Rhodococcus sp. ACT016]|uniref:hypothetical protein n=1 Tax=Rhodococcus sp. ACT016 TaxID=3134808 RepID=UPI003D2C23E7